MKTKPLVLALTSAAVLLSGLVVLPVSAQYALPAPVPTLYQPLSDAQLDQLLGPIALYPDPLLAQILPATTVPTEIVLADRYVASGGDPNLADQQPWDPSVQALTRYPSVLRYLDDNLAWTTQVGLAFLNQQQAVMESIQRLRISAMNFGNLYSTPQQQVVQQDGEIEILPCSPDYIYLPVYQPDFVYYQSGYAPGFGFACTLGPWLNCDFDWHEHHLFWWGRDHRPWRNWWQGSPGLRRAWLAREGNEWHRGTGHGFDGGDRSNRGWHDSTAPATRSFPTIVNMSRNASGPRPPASPRPDANRRADATPRAPANRDFGGLWSERSRPGSSSFDGGSRGGSAGHATPSPSTDNRSQERSPAFARPEAPRHEAPRSAPAYSAPVRSEPAHAAPSRSEPDRSPAPAQHSAPPAQNGGNNESHGSRR